MTLNKVPKEMLGQDVQDEFNKVGDITTLQTTDKSNVVAAINSNTAQLADIATTKVNVLFPPAPYVAAKGDGVTDDTIAIQNLLNAFKRVYLPQTSSFYKITAPLLMNNGYQLEGEGVLTQLKGFGVFNAIIQNNYGIDTSVQVITQVLVKNLYLLKDASATIQFGIDTTNISYSVFDTIEVNGFTDSGILANHISATYNTFNNIITKNNGLDGIRLINNANSTRIYGITSTANGRNGIRIDGNNTQSVETVEIIGGSVESSVQSGIHVDGRGVLISGVHIEGNSLNYAGYGISTNCAGHYNNVVLGCFFWQNGNDANYISHVQGIACNNSANCIQAVFALGTNLMSYIMDGQFNMGANGFVYVGPSIGMYNISNELYLQTGGSGKALNIKGYGGFNVPIKLGSGLVINPDGTLVLAGKSTFFSSAMPTSGSYTQGDYVRNTSPSILGTTPNRYIVKGWYRLTTSNTHVLNTDWWEERVSNGS